MEVSTLVKRFVISTTLAVNTMMFTAGNAFAQTLGLTPSKGFEGLNMSMQALISMGIKFLLTVAALVFFFMLVLGGIKWILSGGDKGKTEEARNQITAALVGLVIVFSAWAITSLFKTFFGVDILNLTL